EYSSMLLHKLIGSFIYYSLKSENTLDLAKEDLVKGITEYLNNNIYDSITLQHLERKFNKSVSSLSAIFKEKTGYSIMHFFSLIKIQKACELINLTNLSIKEISYELNYQDPLYFSRVFKKFMGVSPRAYRQKN
ncbi:MAG: AraC family transcriptional regulator, partial [Bacteroidota bacterium]